MRKSIRGLIRNLWARLRRSLMRELRETLPLIEEARVLGERTREYLDSISADSQAQALLNDWTAFVDKLSEGASND